MKLLNFLILAVMCLNLIEAKKETKKVVVEIPKKEAIDPKGKREAAIHPYSYSPPKPQVIHIQAPSSSLHLGAGYSLGGPKIVGHSSGSHSYSAPTFPLFTPHSPSFSGPVYASPPHFASSSTSPRYTSISAVYKPASKYPSSHINTGPQIFGSNHLIQPQSSIHQPSSVYGFSSPIPSLQHYSATKGLGSYASPSFSSLSNLLSHGSHGGSMSFSIPSGSYGAPSFGGSHGSLLSSFSLGGHSSSSSSNPFAGFFDTHSKPSHAYIGSSSSSSFKPSAFLGSSISAPSSSYGAPSYSSQHSSSPSSSYGPPSYSSPHSSSPSSSYGLPSYSSPHSSSPSSSYGLPSYSSPHSSSPSSSYGLPSISHSSIPSDSYNSPSFSSHSHGSSSSSFAAPSIGGHGSSHGSFSIGSINSHSLPPTHDSLPFKISEADKAKLLSGMPIYITPNELGGHLSGFESSHHGQHGSPSLSGSYEIPSAGHAAPSSSFTHLLGNSISSSYGAPSHSSLDYSSSSLSHESPSSSYGPPSSGYASHETPEESYDGLSDGKGLVTGFSSSITHESPSGHHGSSLVNSLGHDYSGSSDVSLNSFTSGKLELPSLKNPQLFSSPEHGAASPGSSYLPSKSYSPPSSSYGVPHETYGPPKPSFLINADSHDSSSDNTYNTIKYSRNLPVDEKAKKVTKT